MFTPPPRPLCARLAPSPTGALHLGNLSSSYLTWLHTRRHEGRLLLRIEDIDEARCDEGSLGKLIEDLRWCGLDWDGGFAADDHPDIWRQSQRKALYEDALASLKKSELAYACTCSRREVREALSAPHEAFDPGLAYPGTCAGRRAADTPVSPHAWRYRARGRVTHDDEIFGLQSGDIARAPGDVVVRRRDGLFAYQLAVVVDDIEMGVNHVSRGVDLLESVLVQRALRADLGGDAFASAHFPVLHDHRGARLSKRDGSIGVDAMRAAGWTAPLLLGGLCVLWGWCDELDALRPSDALRRFDTATLRRRVINVPEEFFAGPAAFETWIEQQ